MVNIVHYTQPIHKQKKQDMELKKCSICGRELPITNYLTSRVNPDGLSLKCKECTRKQSMQRTIARANKITQQGFKATLKISDFDDNMLIAELRRRGFTGEITYSKVITL